MCIRDSTQYTLKPLSGDDLVEGTDYTINEGKITFLTTSTDSVYVSMSTEAFPKFSSVKAMKTTPFPALPKVSADADQPFRGVWA